jgi:hypothetical protein
MSRWKTLDSFLDTDPTDVGCDEVMNVLHVYAELLRSSRPVPEEYRGVAAHLRACGGCQDDLAGLLAILDLDLDQ